MAVQFPHKQIWNTGLDSTGAGGGRIYVIPPGPSKARACLRISDFSLLRLDKCACLLWSEIGLKYLTLVLSTDLASIKCTNISNESEQ